MKSKYAYVRVTLHGTDHINRPVEVIAGLEVHRGEPIQEQYDWVRRHLEEELTPYVLRWDDDGQLATRVERVLREQWPSRSYFVEVGRGELDEWVQVYQP